MRRDPSQHRLRKGKRKKRDALELAAQLAPLEELDQQGASKQLGGDARAGEALVDPNYGAIVIDNSNLNLPKDLVEGQGGRMFLGMEPVVVVILCLMLVWIVFVAWQISLMPAE